MKNYLWSVLECLAVGCAETPTPAAPAQAPAPPPNAAAPTEQPALAAAATPGPSTIPITSKSPQAIEEF